jgi:hypothetical protein
MNRLQLVVAFAIGLMIILFSNEKFTLGSFNTQTKKYKKKKLVQSKKTQNKLQQQQTTFCKNLNNEQENVTYLINRRAYCRFIDSGLIINKNDIKSWSS